MNKLGAEGTHEDCGGSGRRAAGAARGGVTQAGLRPGRHAAES